MRELECKLKLEEPEGVVARLAALGAVYHGEVHERNRVFDRAGELAARQELLRLRVTDDHAWGILTHKRPAPEKHYKCRVETETRVENAENTRIILESLGFEQDWFYEKKRQSWVLEGCELVIDRLPQLGYYLEIEAPDEPTIDRLLAELGLDRRQNLNTNYRQIWREHCERTGRDFKDWRF